MLSIIYVNGASYLLFLGELSGFARRTSEGSWKHYFQTISIGVDSSI
jgi:hypothetical protein